MTPVAPRKTVLVIDDDAIVRLMSSAVLDEAGYRVLEVADAEAGLERFALDGADLVLLDLLLPGMNGFDACARLRAHARGANVPIIVMTGLDDGSSIARAYDVGATDFITKPIVWDLLPYRVRYALRASDAFQETLRSRTLLSRSQALVNMGSWEWRPREGAMVLSEQMDRIAGLDASPTLPATRQSLLQGVDEADRARLLQALDEALTLGRPYSLEFGLTWPDGTRRRVLEQTEVERLGDDTVAAVHGIRRDITEQTEANERIRTLALLDPLTGLANRLLFGQLLQQRLALASRQATRCAVLLVDLDRFKMINESFGTRTGDEVLKIVGQRLREGAQALGGGLDAPAEERIARLAADEFAVLIDDVQALHEILDLARALLQALEKPFVVVGRELALGASIGIGMTPIEGDDADALLRNASTALHAAKQDPAGERIRFYEDAMGSAVNRQVTIETELRRALQQGELRVFYQGQVDLRDGRAVGAEALVRWMHPVRGLTGPVEFIGVAEQSGLILPLTRWVIAEVCRQLAAWRDEGRPAIAVSINLDVKSLQSAELIPHVAAELARHALAPTAIEFEVTESSLLRDLEHAITTLHALKQIGVRLSIDDFGTGYSSLTYLKRFPVDALKIDRSFVKDLPQDASDAALTTAIIAMGQSLGLELVAEGVETVDQAGFLAQRHCFLIQGFLFARPQPAAAFADWLAAGPCTPPRLARPGR